LLPGQVDGVVKVVILGRGEIEPYFEPPDAIFVERFDIPGLVEGDEVFQPCLQVPNDVGANFSIDDVGGLLKF
jgi:hypothetical protein